MSEHLEMKSIESTNNESFIVSNEHVYIYELHTMNFKIKFDSGEI